MPYPALLAALAAVATLIGAPGRTDADRARDAARKPAEVLAFAQLRPAWKVGEYTPGGGYFTRPHRIDPAQVRAEVEAAGFRFDGESRVLANAADPLTAAVFDPAIRGRTDQLALRFRKP